MISGGGAGSGVSSARAPLDLPERPDLPELPELPEESASGACAWGVVDGTGMITGGTGSVSGT